MTAGYRALRMFSVILLLAVGLTGPAFGADEAGNSINSISVEKHKQEPHVEIQTSEPVGFRYTVYDSQDPRRIIVDFRDMALGDVEASIPVKSSPISEIRTSAFDLTSGKLARVEILLTESAAYDVTLEGKLFKVALKEQQTSGSAKAPQSTATDESKEKAETAG
ncbi:AMIN domain-containing protein, partial [candidate division KSB1 bacterium]|nr:AMIN domain-containing protein [candidate division KSB1 bacterium]NIU23625.1 AMIN domain-containing protein [candidate division KSB1 bacterium]NIU89856.1 AMIN domain-containing protein [candidate division KSB1 bacterium]NIV94616.1 AMIN domain-containing protein [candidate division KSB1 bacterium]NIW17470.1 AMIN domain-containing protein [candidate division KSB1 bacterium]